MSTTEHPIAASVAAAAAAGDGYALGFGEPVEPGWVRAANLAEADVALRWMERTRDFVADRNQTTAGLDVAVSHGAPWYFRALAAALVAVWRADGRVIDLDPEATYVRLVNPWADGVFISSPRFHCAANDPAADHPDAVVAANEAELSAQLRTQLTGHAQPLIAPLGAVGHLGPRTMWGFVSDALADAVSEFGANAPGRAAAGDLLAGEVAPLLSGPRFVELPLADAEPQWTHVTHSCCLSYKVSAEGELCVGCPRVTDEGERLELAEKQAAAMAAYEAAQQALTA